MTTRCTIPPIYVLRHGETEWNVAGRLQGHLDSPLTQKGRRQAATQRAILDRALAGLDVTLRVSPSLRAIDTARLACPQRPYEVDDRLLEIDLGRWTGCRIKEIAAAASHVAAATDQHMWKFTAPGGETLADMVARCRAVLDDLTGPTVLVTHGVTSRVLRCLALGLPPRNLSSLPGGQGIVHHIAGGVASVLRDS